MTPPVALNPEQRAAVEHVGGPLLILAGAGTGKTRVVTHRIAWLLETGAAKGDEILAVTFTNKAAREIRERAAQLAGDRVAHATLSTFHSACARWLRRHGRDIGLSADFTIYDSDDQASLLKQVADELGHPTDASNLRWMRGRIEAARHRAASPHDIQTEAIGHEAERIAELYAAYVQALRRANATDFGGLISSMVHLLESDERLRAGFRARYRFVMVDEFQDTNVAQYRLLRALAPIDADVAVVGDDDQSIYGWRGASVENVRRFRDDYRGRVVALEQNYRSTAPILAAAHAVVSRLPERMDKQLRPTRAGDDPVRLFVGRDDREEAAWVARSIAELRGERGLTWGDFAIFYRTNAQSRAFEDRLRRDGLPYDVIGGVSFFERREVKDLLAYVRLAANPADDVALRRIINVPTRGVGRTTERRLLALVRDGAVPHMRDAVRAAAAGEVARITRRTREGLAQLDQLLDELHALARSGEVAEIIETTVTHTNYRGWLSDDDSSDDRERNIDALIDAARDVAREQPEAGVTGFLEYAALRQATDALDEDTTRVQLMTVHMSKGLEFPVVFVTGLEDGQFPLRRAHADVDDSRDDEERRLCYVAWTRARDLLVLTAADQRMVYGTTRRSPLSAFLTEVPSELLQVQRGSARGTRDTSPHSAATRQSQGWDDYDQRPAHERDTSGGVPRDGIVFDDAFYPQQSVDDARSMVGRRAVHKLFGTGRIVAADPSGDRVRLTIDFPGKGVKKVVASYVEVID